MCIKEVVAHAKQHKVWAVAYSAALLLPWMLAFSRAGMEIGAGLIGLLFLWQSYRSKDWSWCKDPLLLVCLIAWGWVSLVVTPLALNPATSAPSALLWFRMPLLFAALRYWVLKPAAARHAMAGMLLLLLLLVSVDTLWQFVFDTSLTGYKKLDTGRLTGPLNSPNVGFYLSKLLLPALVLALVPALQSTQRNWRLTGLLLVLVVVVATILLSGSRAPFIIALLGVATASGLVMLREKRLRLPLLLTGVALLGMGVALYQHSPYVQTRAAQAQEMMANYSQSSYGMLAIAGYEMGREHLVHGIGIKGFRDLCPDLHIPSYDRPFRGLYPHNMFIEWFAEAGLPGLLLFLAMIALMARTAWQHFRAAQGMVCLVPALVMGVLVQQFFPLMGMQSFFINWSGILVWYPLGLAFAALPRHRC